MPTEGIKKLYENIQGDEKMKRKTFKEVKHENSRMRERRLPRLCYLE
jgi:hypothetical protein